MSNKRRIRFPAAAGAAAMVLAFGSIAALPMTVRGQEATPAKLTNAAQAKLGARLNVVAPPKGATRDPATPPEATFDGDAHSRCVLRGSPPYTFIIELPVKARVDRLALSHSDYASERAPKDIEITLDDGGPTVRHTLELRRPERRRQPAWQEVPLGNRTARVVRVTVHSNYEPDPKVNWGGLAEITVLTPDDIAAFVIAPDKLGPDTPAFVHTPPRLASVAPKVTLPAPARPGEHPRLLLTRAEAADLKATLERTERGKGALRALIGVADAAAKTVPEFPDPKGTPAQLKDRGDEIARRHDRLSLNAGTLGVAYALTGDEKYAQAAAAILKGYAERYDAYPEHKGANRSDTGKVMAQRLSEAMWLIPLIEAFDYIHDSRALTPDDRKRIENDLIRPCIAFIRRKEPRVEAAERTARNPQWRTVAPAGGGGIAGNWLLFYNAATLLAGATLGDRDLVDLGAADVRSLLMNGIGEDGMWREGAIGYQFFAITALIPAMEAAARQGIDLWGFAGGRAKMLFDSPLRYAYPDGSAPGINDSGRRQMGDWSAMAYDYAYLRYGDPAYAVLVESAPRQVHMSQAVYFPTRIYEPLPAPPPAAAPGSTVFESLGYAILRNGTRAYALMDYGPHGGVHGHADKLNLILYATGADGKGDEMGGEPKFHRYEDPLHAEWTTQTVAHNTLTVDETSQVASDGRLLLFEDTPDLKVMRARSTTSAPGAVLDRTVIVLPDAVLDIYHGRSARSRTWDRTLRFNGMLTGFPDTSANAAPFGGRDGYQHLKAAARKPGASTWQGTWQTKAGAFAVTAAGPSRQEVILATGPDGEHVALARQTGTRADFAAAYGMESWSNPVRSLKVLPVDEAVADVTAAEMTQTDGTVTTVIVAHAPGRWKALGWSSDARVLCLRRKGDVTTVLLGGGQSVEAPGGASYRTPSTGNFTLARRGGSGRFEVLSEWNPTAAAVAAP